MGAMQMIAERLAAPFLLRQEQIESPFAVVKSLFDGIQDALLVLAAKRQSVDDHLQRTVTVGSCVEFVNFANGLIDEQAMKAGLTQAVAHFVPGHRRGRQGKSQYDWHAFG